MSVAAFLTAALESALDNEVATPDDVLRHATPDVLAAHLPRPVWTRLLTACLTASRLDTQLVVETIGVGTLCEHVPPAIMWGCLTEIAHRALGRGLVAAPPASAGVATAAVPASSGRAGTAPIIPAPPIGSGPVPRAGTDGGAGIGSSSSAAAARVATPPRGTTLGTDGRPTNGAPPPVHDPAAEVTRIAQPPVDISRLAAERSELRGELTRVGGAPREPEPLGEPPAPPRAPGATTRGASPAAGARRPQAAVGVPPAASSATPPLSKTPRGTPPPTATRRATTATDFEIETDVNEQWKRSAAGSPPPVEVVEEDQLIDWASSEETATLGDKYGDRKPR